MERGFILFRIILLDKDVNVADTCINMYLPQVCCLGLIRSEDNTFIAE